MAGLRENIVVTWQFFFQKYESHFHASTGSTLSLSDSIPIALILPAGAIASSMNATPQFPNSSHYPAMIQQLSGGRPFTTSKFVLPFGIVAFGGRFL